MKKYITYEEVLAEKMKSPEFKRAYEALGPRYEAINAVIKMRIEKGLSQKALAKVAKTKQSNISRLESGKVIPSLKLLQKIAQAFNKELRITFR